MRIEKRWQQILASAIDGAIVEPTSGRARPDLLIRPRDGRSIPVEVKWAGEGWPQDVRRAAGDVPVPWPPDVQPLRGGGVAARLRRTSRAAAGAPRRRVIRAVVDPGVLVSAFIGRQGSVTDRIVRAWRAGRVELVVSPALLDELSGVLARPKFASAAREGRAVDFVGALRVGATMVADAPGTEAITRDPKDDYLVRPARSSAVAALVSGDRDLLEADVGDVEVLAPRTFLDRVDPTQA